MNITADCIEVDGMALTKKALLVVAALATGFVAFGTSRTAAQSTLQRGMPISQFRAELLREQWMPVRIDKKLADGERENMEAEARLLYEAGFFEVESCTGTGENLCFLNYQRRGECLRALTVGEYFSPADEPKLYSWTNECPD